MQATQRVEKELTMALPTHVKLNLRNGCGSCHGDGPFTVCAVVFRSAHFSVEKMEKNGQPRTLCEKTQAMRIEQYVDKSFLPACAGPCFE